MTRQIALFAAPLTTRGVADIVKSAGVAGLPSATRLADDAHYQEVVCRSAGWVLEPKRQHERSAHLLDGLRHLFEDHRLPHGRARAGDPLPQLACTVGSEERGHVFFNRVIGNSPR